MVGRDTGAMSEPGVARSSVEKTVEKSNDAVIASTFWIMVGGLQGILIYKIANTSDSRVGHRNAKNPGVRRGAHDWTYLLHTMPTRLTGFLICVVALIQCNGHVACRFNTACQPGAA